MDQQLDTSLLLPAKLESAAEHVLRIGRPLVENEAYLTVEVMAPARARGTQQ